MNWWTIKEILFMAGIKPLNTMGSMHLMIHRPSTIWDGSPDSITFCNREKISDMIGAINASKAGAIIADPLTDEERIHLDISDKTIIMTNDARSSFALILDKCFKPEAPPWKISPSAEIDPEAQIHETARIGAHCWIGKAIIGEASIVYPNVTINDGVRIGRNVIINPGCSIGFDGFSYIRTADGMQKKFHHYGGVIIEDDVEIGSNTSIDRGTLGDTLIKQGSKIDNLCHIAHNVEIGVGCLIIAHAMIGGSTKIDDHSWISPCAAIIDGIKIGKYVTAGLGAVVIRDVPDMMIVAGNPAKDLNKRTEKGK
jgi:UDP-3-O-[3-hydroxymyristoyl] glucosamine N-acyltransferase